MHDLKFGDFCWCYGEGWVYLGVTDEGCISLARPAKSIPNRQVEHASVDVSDEDEYDSFCEENGELFNERCKRKGIAVPESEE